MTVKQFWQDPYQTLLETHVDQVDGDAITLAETIFYAFSGGQESDAGTIGGHPVLNARKDGLAIWYTLPAEHGLTSGDAVTVRIDWERRYQLMRLHFAAEIILELVYQRLPGIVKIGAHIAQDKSRIDFEWPENLAALFPELLDRARQLISADHPIISAYSDPAAERRTWEIEGFARVDCGGTHLRRTGEVGAITLKRKNVGKGKERIEIFVD
ncbi:MAG: alanyl-tRNA editing protein [Anaerolineae bacterium]|nr:alanyl-tRNA editing protein [Anaerolineae bacterium]